MKYLWQVNSKTRNKSALDSFKMCTAASDKRMVLSFHFESIFFSFFLHHFSPTDDYSRYSWFNWKNFNSAFFVSTCIVVSLDDCKCLFSCFLVWCVQFATIEFRIKQIWCTRRDQWTSINIKFAIIQTSHSNRKFLYNNIQPQLASLNKKAILCTHLQDIIR